MILSSKVAFVIRNQKIALVSIKKQNFNLTIQTIYWFFKSRAVKIFISVWVNFFVYFFLIKVKML